jgi:hypothetical protein
MSDSARRIVARYLKAGSTIPAGVIGAVNTALQRGGLDGGVSFSSPGEALLLAQPALKRYGLTLTSPLRLTGLKGNQEASLLFKGEPDPSSLFKVSWLRGEDGTFEVIAFLL